MSKTSNLQEFLAAPERFTEAHLGLSSSNENRNINWQTFASALRNSSQLQYLALYNNHIEDFGAAAIAQGLVCSNSLKTLSIEGNQIATIGAYALGQALAQNKSLTILNISGNKIGADGASGIGWGLAQSFLMVLDISTNQIGGAGGASIGQALAQNSTLTELYLYNNQIGDAGGASIGQALAQNSTLTMLKLHGNQIGDEGARSIGEGLAQNSTLTMLELLLNQIGGAGGASIGQGLAQNRALTELRLDSNQIGDEGARSIGEALGRNSTLIMLDLSSNQIGEVGGASVGQGLVQNSALTSLKLRSNQMGEVGGISIGQGLAQNRALRHLDLHNNQISDAGAISIGQGLAQNSTLTDLYLDSNQIGDEGARSIGKGLEQNSTLGPYAPCLLYNPIGAELMDQISQLMRGVGRPATQPPAEDIVIAEQAEEKDEITPEPGDILAAEVEHHLEQASGIVEQHRGVQNLSYLIAEGDGRIDDAGEQAILIMGKTGTGKTTLAHMLTNQALRAFVNDRGQMVIEAAQDPDRGGIGHGYDSETTVPNKFVAGEKVIWDCPGLGDTNVEQSVANSFYIQKLVRSSQQVMLVLAVEANFITGGGRGGAFIGVLDSFIKTFNNMEHLVSSVSLVVTHVENDTQLAHMVNDIRGRIEAHGTVTDTMRAIIDSVIERGAIHLIRKPQAEGGYEYEPNLLGSIEDSCAYAEVEPESVNVVLSREHEVEFVQRVHETTGHNINALLKLLQVFISHAQITGDVQSAGSNILVKYYNRLVKPLLPTSELEHRVDQLESFFPHLKQLALLNDLFAPYEQLGSIQEGAEMMGQALVISEQLFGTRGARLADGPELQSFGMILSHYGYMLLQQCNYFKFLSEIIVANNSYRCAEGATQAGLEESLLANFGKVIEYCKKRVSVNMEDRVEFLEMEEDAGAGYYLEAIEYFAQYTGNSNENVSKSAHKNIAKAEIHLAEIAERELAGAPDAERAEALYQEAVEHYARAISHNKEIAKIYSKLGKLFFDHHDYEKAVACYKIIDDFFHVNKSFKAWLELDEENPEIWLKRGDISLSFGQNEKALKYYEMAFGLSDDESFKEAAMHKRADACAACEPAARARIAAELHRNADAHDLYHFDAVGDEFATRILGVGVEDGAAADA